MLFKAWSNPPLAEFDRMVEIVGHHIYEKTGLHSDLMDGAYYIHEDYLGWAQVLVHIEDLRLLTPHFVESLRELLSNWPRWEIVVIVCKPGGADWPDMGLFVRRDEVIDGLQRAYLPPEFQSMVFKHGRPGTERD